MVNSFFSTTFLLLISSYIFAQGTTQKNKGDYFTSYIDKYTTNYAKVQQLGKESISGNPDLFPISRTAKFSYGNKQILAYFDSGYPNANMKIVLNKKDTLSVNECYKNKIDNEYRHFIFSESITLHSLKLRKKQYLVLSGGSVLDFHHRENSELTYFCILDITNNKKIKVYIIGNIGGIKQFGDFNNDGILDVLLTEKENYSEKLLFYKTQPFSLFNDFFNKKMIYNKKSDYFMRFKFDTQNHKWSLEKKVWY